MKRMRLILHRYHNMNIKKQYIILVEIIVISALLFSYIIFTKNQIKITEKNIKSSLRDSALMLASNETVQEKLYLQENDGELQTYATELTDQLNNIDLIVIADMTGEKYSHPDSTQVGQIFIGEDKAQVLKSGESYYTIKEGSMGTTLRYFCPVYYGDGQVGFIMVGKYTTVIHEIYYEILFEYIALFICVAIITFLLAARFADRYKQIILDMEPEEIAALYLQKNTIINHVQEAVILLDSSYQIQDVNKKAEKLLAESSEPLLLKQLQNPLKNRETITLQEFIIGPNRYFISMSPLIKNETYYGAVITLYESEEVNRVAKEITGIEQTNKNMRAIIHEFKNNLHIILGLLQLKEYEEAQKYILKIQQLKVNQMDQFSSIKDSYIKAMLISKSSIAAEKQVRLILAEESNIMEKHGVIDSYDLITIIGNLIENALDACTMSNDEKKQVIVLFKEDKTKLMIKVTDNGVGIDHTMIDSIYELGTSTKGEGRGTGLYLIKKRVQMYGGTIQIVEGKQEKSFIVCINKGEKHDECINS